MLVKTCHDVTRDEADARSRPGVRRDTGPHRGPVSVRTEGWARFERLVAACAHHPARVALALALLTVGFCFKLPQLEIQSDPTSFIPDDSPERATMDRYIRRYGSDEVALVVVEIDDPFDAANLRRLYDLHQRLDAGPQAADVRSLVNLPDVGPELNAASGDQLIADPQSIDPDHVRTVADSIGLAEGRLYGTGDQPFLAVAVRLAGTVDPDDPASPIAGGAEFELFVDDIGKAVDAVSTDGFEPATASALTFAVRTARVITLWTALSVALAIATVGLLLMAFFRHVAGAVVPLATVGLALAWTMGLMAWTGSPVDAFSQVLILLVLVAGIADSVHVQHRFVGLREDGLERVDAAIVATQSKATAILFTTLTSAGGFATFVLTGSGPVARLGLFGACGIVFALVATVLLAPAALAVLPARLGMAKAGWMGDNLTRAAGFGVRRRAWVLGAAVAMFLVSGWLAWGTEIRADASRWTAGDEAIEELAKVEQLVGNSIGVDIIVEMDEPGAIATPEGLALIDRLTAVVEESTITGATPVVEPTVSDLVQIVPELDPDPALRAMDELDYYPIDTIVASDHSAARVTLRIPYVEQLEALDDIDALELRLESAAGDQAEIIVTGGYVATGRALDRLLPATVTGYGMALLVISILMCIGVRSIRRGIVAMIPNLLPTVVVLGIMGATDTPLDLVTVVVGAIVIGVAVDDTVHVVHSLFLDQDRTGDLERDLERTMRTTGPALVVTSAVIGLGLLSGLLTPFTFMKEVAYLGGLAVGLALVADIVLIPALVATLARTYSSSSGWQRSEEHP